MNRWCWLLLTAGCGGGWAEADTKAATGSARTQLMVEAICSPGEDCKPEQVRALVRSSYCLDTSMLYRRNLPIPDGGIACQPH